MAANARHVYTRLKKHALSLPEAWEDHPWEDDAVVKVGRKIFVFFGGPASTGMSVKLPASASDALMLPCSAPTGYGLGRGGWVTLEFTHDACPPFELLREWIDESYRAIAPKKLSATMAGAAEPVGTTPRSQSRGSARKR
jgi:predicted DNA-binding protein (MmcQ/YjbR family)